jgi:transposase
MKEMGARVLRELRKTGGGWDRSHRLDAQQRLQARRLMTHPGVGPVTALAKPTIFISASFVPSLFGWYRKVYSGRREADVLMPSPTRYTTQNASLY